MMLYPLVGLMCRSALILVLPLLLLACTAFEQDTTDKLTLSPDKASKDTQAPHAPVDLHVWQLSEHSMKLQWSTPADTEAVAYYSIYRDDVFITTTTDTSFIDDNLQPNTDYHYRITATDAANNTSSSTSITFRIYAAADLNAPSIPANLSATNISSNSLTLSWNASSDDTAVTGYLIMRDGAEAGQTSSHQFTDNNLQAGTVYVYTVSAVDAAGNRSAESDAVSPSTLFETPAPVSCADTGFSFAVFSDNYSGQEGALRRIFSEMHDLDPNIHFLASAGDTPGFERVRSLVDRQLTSQGKLLCGANEFPWFPATGNHDAEVESNMQWWATNWASNWDNNADSSRLASQLPGLSDFKRGPLLIQRELDVIGTPPGSIYSFNYKNVHFVFINNYEQAAYIDNYAGVWDMNGPLVFAPETSQLDWLEQDLQANSTRLTFVFGHVALTAPCYNYNTPSSDFACDGPAPPGWSEHNFNFHTDELTELLSQYPVAGFFHGHDHVPSRLLINSNRSIAYERKYWDVANDPKGAYATPSDWENLQGAGRVWQVDAGAAYTGRSSYVIVRVDEQAVEYKFYAYGLANGDTTSLWDTWSIPKTSLQP